VLVGKVVHLGNGFERAEEAPEGGVGVDGGGKGSFPMGSGGGTYIHRTEKAARTVNLSARCICRRQTMCTARRMLQVSSTSMATEAPVLNANCFLFPTHHGGRGQALSAGEVLYALNQR